ncbi:MAG TPA: glycosyltransferase family 2 protein [Puia sp.]|nr:glycosyltransferase family 2 protein [Puia sp.]
MSNPSPLISVIIPTKNGDAWLAKTISAILDQTLSDQTEIIIMDSGSTDNTAEILSRYPVWVIPIEPSSFNHGGTRNVGVRHAKGKYIVMTVQDAEPDSRFWLQNLLDGFDDEKVAGVCGQQIVPHDPENNPVDWFRPVSAPDKKKFFFDRPADFEALTAAEQRNICRWDDVNAMYRRDVLLSLPFRFTSFAEDALWARDALMAGYAIVYNTAARVKHYHFETPEYAFRRSFTVYYHMYIYFSERPSRVDNGLIMLLRNSKLLLKESRIGWPDKWKWLLFNYRQRTAINKAIDIFNDALAKGRTELDCKHNEICRTPPQALKPGRKEIKKA